MTLVTIIYCDRCNPGREFDFGRGVVYAERTDAKNVFGWRQDDELDMCYLCQKELDATPPAATPA